MNKLEEQLKEQGFEKLKSEGSYIMYGKGNQRIIYNRSDDEVIKSFTVYNENGN